MHRYQPDTIARIRTDYVHEQQARYRTAIADLEQRIANASTGERVKLNRKLTTLQAQDTEIRTYEEKIHHLADQMISIELDDGVKKNYAIFQDVLAKIKWEGLLMMTANPILLQKKYARVIECFAKQQGLSLDEALGLFYHSEVYQLMRDGVSDMHCMSDLYLVEELRLEYTEKFLENCQ